MEDFQVSKQSWHFRLNTFCYGCEPSGTTSLCNYFWKTIFGVVKLVAVWFTIIVAVLISGGVFLFGSLYLTGVISTYFLAWLGIIPQGVFDFKDGVFDWKFIPAALLVDCVIGYLIFMYTNPKKALKWFNKKKPVLDDEPKKQSLFIEFIKAKKRKICPLITFKD